MQNKKLALLLLPVVICFVSFSLFASGDWEKEFTKEGITVYTRPVEGSSLREFRGEGIIDAPLEVCRNVIDDTESHTKWRPDCIEAKSFKSEGKDFFSYNETKAPWPVSNRDVVIKTQITETKQKVVYNFTAVDRQDLMPLKDGVVRMTRLTGMWILERKGDKTHVTYQASVDPGGSIPSWLANKTSKDQPYKSLLGLRDMVKDPKYLNK
jgi:hypothetical protein